MVKDAEKELEKESMRLRLPGGAELWISGRWILLIFVIVVATVVGTLSIYMLYEHKEAVKADDLKIIGQLKHGDEKIVLTIVQGIDDLRAAQVKTTEAQNELNYIMLLSSEDRAKLKLQMPESLRRKLRGDGQ